MNLMTELLEFSKLFDAGATIYLGEDEVVIEGVDYHPADNIDDPYMSVTRVFVADKTWDEETGDYADTLTPLKEIIRQDNERLAEQD
jgi:hypothetical protein